MKKEKKKTSMLTFLRNKKQNTTQFTH